MHWPTESSKKWLKNRGRIVRGNIQVLHTHVDARGEGGHSREETVRSCCYTYYLRREAWVESESEGGRGVEVAYTSQAPGWETFCGLGALIAALALDKLWDESQARKIEPVATRGG
jgi:hypothetical protein